MRHFPSAYHRPSIEGQDGHSAVPGTGAAAWQREAGKSMEPPLGLWGSAMQGSSLQKFDEGK